MTALSDNTRMSTEHRRADIVLMGPAGAGKTTVAEHISHLLNWPRLSLDAMQQTYLKELSDFTHVVQILEYEPFTSPRLQAYHVHIVERAFQDLQQAAQPHVVEFGYGHSLYKDKRYIQRFAETLNPYPNTFLLLPSANHREAVELLYVNIMSHPLKRFVAKKETFEQMNAHAVRLYSQRRIAKHVVYTKGLTVEQTCDEVLRLAHVTD